MPATVLVRSPLLQRLHLNRTDQLLTVRAIQVLRSLFHALDIHQQGALNDLQFLALLRTMTNLSEKQCYRLFDMLDIDKSGTLEFDEFYVLMCILIAIKDGREKEFLFKHSQTCFNLIDVDGSGTITLAEFQKFGFIFNISAKACQEGFKAFDVDDSKELDYEEFRMFCLVCLDKQQELEQPKVHKLRRKFQTGTTTTTRGCHSFCLACLRRPSDPASSELP